MFASGAGLAIQISATAILARLLTPGDFGLVTMVSTFSLLFVNFGLNGFTEAVVQREEIDCDLVSNLFWINLAAGFVLTGGFALSGALLGRFYGDPRIARLAAGMSPTIALTSASVLHLALLKRALRFSAVSANDILARGISVAVSIVLAWAGWGYWALAAGALSQPLVSGIGAWLLCRWIPRLPSRASGTAAMVRFAVHIYGRFGINYFARNVDNLLVGWRFDAQSLGFYKKAYDLFALSASQLVSPLSNVAVAALSRLKPDSREYSRYLLNALGMVAFVGMGVGADLTLVGADVIRLLLGPGWETAGRIFTFFGPGIGMMLLYGAHGWVHLSIGRPDRWLRWGALEFLLTGGFFAAGLPFGPEGVAAAWAASFWVLTLPAFWYAGRPVGLGPGAVIGACWKYLAASLAGAVASVRTAAGMPALLGAPGPAGAAIRILVLSALFAGFYLGAIVLLHRGGEPLRQVARLLREMLPGRLLAVQAARTPAAGATP